MLRIDLKNDAELDNMCLDLRGILPASMIDWPGRLSCVVFLGGCNLRCPFCQNYHLIDSDVDNNGVRVSELKEYLLSKKDWLDGVVITGGEPSINHGLGDLISLFKVIGYPVKLDTNGTRPRVLSRLIKDGLVDYFAQDIKTSFHKYDLLKASKDDALNAEEGMDIIIESKIDHEFRTTAVPGLVSEEDMINIATMLARRGAKRYFIQQFNPDDTLSDEFKGAKPYKLEVLKRLTQECNKLIPTELRGSRMAGG